MKTSAIAPVVCCTLLLLHFSAMGATQSTVATEDAFVTSGNPGNADAGQPTANYGGTGALMISPAGAAKGEMQSLLKFNLSTIKTSFDVTFGIGNWVIDGVTLSLGTNAGVQGSQPMNLIFNTINGGLFGLSWMANDNWGEGTGTPMTPFTPSNPPVDGVTYNTLSSLLSGADRSLGTFTYTPPGVNNGPAVPYTLSLDSSFVADIMAGGNVSLRGFAADTSVGYLFNAKSFATNKPTLTVSAHAVPEPGTLSLLAGVVLPVLLRRRRHARTA